MDYLAYERRGLQAGRAGQTRLSAPTVSGADPFQTGGVANQEAGVSGHAQVLMILMPTA